MPPCLVVELNEWQRRRLGFALIGLNLCVVCGGIGFLLCEWQLRVRVSLIQHAANYGAEALEWLLVMSGIVFVVLHSVGARFAWDAAVYYNRHRVADFLELWVLCILSVVCLNGMGALLASAQQSHLIHVLDRELGVALHEYDGRQQTRIVIDRLQIQLQCCGDRGYLDWLKVAWKLQVPYDAGDKFLQNEDVVPFSCCRPSFPGPCLRHRGSQPLTMERLLRESVHVRGCRMALRNYINYVLTDVIILHVFTFVLQLIILALTRYLQTSIATSYLNSNPFLPSVGWLFEDFGSLTSQKKVWAEEARDRLEAKRIAAAWITVTRGEKRRQPCVLHSNKEPKKVLGEAGLNPYYLSREKNEETVADGKRSSVMGKSSFKENFGPGDQIYSSMTIPLSASQIPERVSAPLTPNRSLTQYDERKTPLTVNTTRQADFCLDISPIDNTNHRSQAGSSRKEPTKRKTRRKSDKNTKRHRNEKGAQQRHERSSNWRSVREIQRLTAGGPKAGPSASVTHCPAISLAALEALERKNIRVIHEKDGLLIARAKDISEQPLAESRNSDSDNSQQ